MFIAFVILIKILETNTMNGISIGNDFKILENQDINSVPSDSLISNVNKLTRNFCLSFCSSNSGCLASVFNDDKRLKNNCFLYNRHFNTNELISWPSSTLYDKINSVSSNFNFKYLTT